VLLDFLVGFVMLLVLLLVSGVGIGWPILLTPVWLLFIVLLASGIGIAASAITVKYRDLTYVLPWVLQILLYATPIAYSLAAVPQNLLWLFSINPLTWAMEVFRWSFLGQAVAAPWQLAAFPLASIVVFFGGMLVFQKMERGFADVI
jgi:lipopolysaccharide transport system permease protein